MTRFTAELEIIIEADSLDAAKAAIHKAMKTVRTDTNGNAVNLYDYGLDVDFYE